MLISKLKRKESSIFVDVNKYKSCMKRVFPFLILAIFFIDCKKDTPKDDGQWWGNRPISTIERSNGRIEKFSYDENNRLIHYYSANEIDSTRNNSELEIHYDVNIAYVDSVVRIEGIMPFDRRGILKYPKGISVYKLNKEGFADLCTTTYLNDTIDTELITVDTFRYENKQLVNIVIEKYTNTTLSYRNNNPYSIQETYLREFPVTLDYRIGYDMENINKSCLVGVSSAPLNVHLPAFYVRILGRPSKYLTSSYSVQDGRLSHSYEYEYDEAGYVTKVTESSGSNIRIFGDDLFGKEITKVITYVE